MRTTLNLSEDLMEGLMRMGSFHSKTEAIHAAIAEYIQRHSAKKLISLFGKIDIDTDWVKHEKEELHHLAARSRR